MQDNSTLSDQNINLCTNNMKKLLLDLIKEKGVTEVFLFKSLELIKSQKDSVYQGYCISDYLLKCGNL